MEITVLKIMNNTNTFHLWSIRVCLGALNILSPVADEETHNGEKIT